MGIETETSQPNFAATELAARCLFNCMNETENKSTFWSQFFVWATVICVCAFVAALVIPNLIRQPPTFVPCIINLRQLDVAKQEWALENGKTNGTIATENDIKPYIKLDSKGNLPKCPQGGIYMIGKVGEPVTCSLGTNVNPPHVLPYP